MKTLTIRSAQNIPIHTSYIIEVDGEKIGLVKTGATAYFDIEENAKSVTARMQGAKTSAIDISENTHHSLIINSKKQILNGYIFVLIYIILSFGATFLFKLELMYSTFVNFGLAIIIYFLYKRSRHNIVELSLIEN